MKQKMAEPGPLESAAAVGPHTQGKGFATYSVAQRGAPDSPHSMQGMEKQRVQERIDRAGQKATIDALRTRPQAYRSTDKHALRMARPSKRHSPSRVMVVAQFCDGQDSTRMLEWGSRYRRSIFSFHCQFQSTRSVCVGGDRTRRSCDRP